MIVFDGELFAGTMNFANGAELWRSSDGRDWRPVEAAGFARPSTSGIRSMSVYRDQLYLATFNASEGCEIWRSADGATWERVVSQGFYGRRASSVRAMSAFDGFLYAADSEAAGGGQVWRAADGFTWTATSTPGFGDPGNVTLSVMTVFQDHLYVGTGRVSGGCQLWRSPDGLSWSATMTGGFGNPMNEAAWSMLEFRGHLYVGTMNWTEGCEIWRSADGASWERVTVRGWADHGNAYVWQFAEYRGLLWAGTLNAEDGCEIWRSANGTDWELVIDGGFGAKENYGARAFAEFHGSLFTGLANPYEGCQIREHRPWIRVPEDLPSLQAAIDAADDGDDVLAAPGRYHERLRLANTQVQLRSTGRSWETIIDAQQAGRAVEILCGPGVRHVLQGFTITGGNCDSDGGGIYVSGGPAVLADLFVTNNCANRGGGIAINGVAGTDAALLMRNVLLTDNTADTSGGGVAVISGGLHAAFCTLSGNHAPLGGGAVVCQGNMRLEHSIIASNSSGVAASGPGSSGLLRRNLFWNNDGADYQQLPPGQDDLAADPLFVSGPGYAFYLSQGAAGQESESPAADAAMSSAAEECLDFLTTRTDLGADQGRADLGYHGPGQQPTPTPTAYAPPSGTQTPALPTPTPDGYQLDFRLELNAAFYRAGERFLLLAHLRNAGPDLTAERYIALEAAGQYWFWPEWTDQPAPQPAPLPTGTARTDVILEFTWPANASGGRGTFWGAAVRPGTFSALAPISSCSFEF